MPRTIMIDGFNLALDKGTGVSTYARNLSYEVHELGYQTEVCYGANMYSGKDRLMREISFFDPTGGIESGLLWKVMKSFGVARDLALGTHIKAVPVSGKVERRVFQSRLPYADKIWNERNLFATAQVRFAAFRQLQTVRARTTPDIMHWTYPLPVRMKDTKNIYTLHDLVPLRLPYTTLDQKRFYLSLARRLVKTADHIVTVSETSRRDIIELLDCPEDKVTNTFQSVDIPKKFLDLSDAEVKNSIEGVYGLPYKDYFLFFGSLEPKKNIGRLIEGYLASQVPRPLVIVGARAWKSTNELKLLNSGVTDDRVKMFEYASFPLLVNLIRGAKAVVFPSLYEGFGLPILEAMMLGTPVITSREGATAEVAGDAALMVDPYNPRDISEAIIQMDHDRGLRERLSAAGRDQAKIYSREAYRERLQALYDKVLATPA